jgi:hypothetical protein
LRFANSSNHGAWPPSICNVLYLSVLTCDCGGRRSLEQLSQLRDEC